MPTQRQTKKLFAANVMATSHPIDANVMATSHPIAANVAAISHPIAANMTAIMTMAELRELVAANQEPVANRELVTANMTAIHELTATLAIPHPTVAVLKENNIPPPPWCL